MIDKKSPPTRKKGPIPLPAWTKQTAIAFQALAAGVANDGQQKECLRWIIFEAALTYDMTFVPESDRLSAFAEGRRMVGNQIIKLVNMKIGLLKDDS